MSLDVAPLSSSGYLICGTPRTGSTLLCGLLRATGVAGNPESYFREPDELAWAARWGVPRRADGSLDYDEFVRAAVREGTTPNGVFGARVMWGTLDDMCAKLRAASKDGPPDDLALLTKAFGPLRFIHIWREHQVAQAVSWARAEQTGYWQQGDGVLREPTFELERIGQLVRMIDEHNLAWRRWFDTFGVRVHELRYEELTADLEGTLRRAMGFLDLCLPAGHRVTAGHRRQADRLNAEWVARYESATRR